MWDEIVAALSQPAGPKRSPSKAANGSVRSYSSSSSAVAATARSTPRAAAASAIARPSSAAGVARPSGNGNGNTSSSSNNNNNSSSNNSFSNGHYNHKIKLNDRVAIPGDNGDRQGTALFVGPVDFQGGVWVGVALDDASGKHNGLVHGVQYFECEPE